MISFEEGDVIDIPICERNAQGELQDIIRPAIICDPILKKKQP